MKKTRWKKRDKRAPLFSDSPLFTDVEEWNAPFQQVTSADDLMEQLHEQDSNLLLFSVLQLQENQIHSYASALLQKWTLLMPLPTDTHLVQQLELRLDSRDEKKQA